MAISELTKAHIAATFKALVGNGTASKIAVLDICRKAGIGKNTFYYHFRDRGDLLYYIFRKELAERIEDSFTNDVLVSEHEGNAFSQYPFYINRRHGDEALDLSDFYLLFCSYVIENRQFYREIMRSDLWGEFTQRGYVLYHPELEKDLRFMAGDKSLPDEVIASIAGWMVSASFGYAWRFVSSPHIRRLSDIDLNSGALQLYCNITHECLGGFLPRMIEAYEQAK